MPNPNETSAHANGGASTSSGVQNDSNITSDVGPSGDAGPIAGPTADAGTPSNRPTASSTPDRSFVTPEIIRPLPKAAPRQSKQGMGCRKKLSSTILTSTPVKEQLRKEQDGRREKRKKTLRNKEAKEALKLQQRLARQLEESDDDISPLPRPTKKQCSGKGKQ